jgi:nucleoside-triphosphatase THEP1
MINIITGKVNTGKTRFLQELYEREKHGDGVVSVKYFEKGIHRGYDLRHLKSGKEKPFIRLREDIREDCRVWGKYAFLPEAFDFADRILKNKGPGPAFIDEIGPLEVLKKQGFYPLLPDLFRREKEIWLSVREALLETLTGILPEHESMHIIRIP